MRTARCQSAVNNVIHLSYKNQTVLSRTRPSTLPSPSSGPDLVRKTAPFGAGPPSVRPVNAPLQRPHMPSSPVSSGVSSGDVPRFPSSSVFSSVPPARRDTCYHLERNVTEEVFLYQKCNGIPKSLATTARASHPFRSFSRGAPSFSASLPSPRLNCVGRSPSFAPAPSSSGQDRTDFADRHSCDVEAVQWTYAVCS